VSALSVLDPFPTTTPLRVATARPILEVEDLRVRFNTRGRPVEAVRGVTFSLEAGKTLILLGESGSGKSVTSRAILRLYGPSAAISGRIRLGDHELLSLDERAMRGIRGGTVALVPQDPTASLDPLQRAGSQIMEVLRRHGLELNAQRAALRTLELLRQVGIPDPERVARAYPHELSGGMRQRVLIAIAIACSPKLLIADEPTTALDVTIQSQVLELFATLQQELGMALLMITHDVGVAAQMADRVAVMYAGRLVEEGPVKEVLESPSHPYTIGLLGAVPTPRVSRGKLLAIPGRPPAAGEHIGPGCAFAPRCWAALDSCRTTDPLLEEVSSDHFAACPVQVAMP
jgi:oligopeptide/dipeptide ABC transporter ATP-binding protein